MCDETMPTFIKREHPRKEEKKIQGASVLIALIHCRLQVENLDYIFAMTLV
jgi:hypothetical protein